MEQGSGSGEQKREILTGVVGNNYTSTRFKSGYIEIDNLIDILGKGAELGGEMEPEHLEMLEAELRNQAMVVRESELPMNLTQLVAHEISVLKWRARRHGLLRSELKFSVELPRYVAETAMELISLDRELQRTSKMQMHPSLEIEETPRTNTSSNSQNWPSSGFSRRVLPWHSMITGREQIACYMRYLNSIAKFLNGNSPSERNGYQRGLNVILRVLSTPTPTIRSGATIKLPITLKGFLEALRER